MSYLAPQPSFMFNSSGAPDLQGFRCYYKPVVDGTEPVAPFSYADSYFTIDAWPIQDPVRLDYTVQLDIPDVQGQMRLSLVEVDTTGNMSGFSPELLVTLDSVAPAGVTDLQLVPTN